MRAVVAEVIKTLIIEVAVPLLSKIPALIKRNKEKRKAPKDE